MHHFRPCFRGPRSQWARVHRALAAIVVLSIAACSASQGTVTDAPGASESPMPPDEGDGTGSNPGPSGAAITVAVQGPGRITSTPAGIDCGAGATACTARFTAASVVLTTDGATTVRWSGDCGGNGDCVVAPGASRAITAETFAPLRRTFDGADHGSDACYAIAAGPGDSIVVTGEVQRIAQGHDAWARAYDAAGSVLWSYELSTPSEGHDRGTGIVALSDGSALVAGTWYSGSNTQWNSFVVDVSSAGTAAWSQVNEIVGDDRYNAIAHGADGQLFVAGARADAGGQTQAWLHALSTDGGAGWDVLRGGTATGIAVDAAGDVVAVGSETNAGTGLDGWIATYAPDGALRWSVPLAGPGADAVSGVAVGPEDSIAVVGALGGASTIRVYSAAGEPRWDVTAGDGTSWSGVAVDATGNVVVTGSLGSDLVARKYTAARALVWQRTIPGARGQAVAIDGHGNVLVCGAVTTAGNTDALIVTLRQ